MQNYRTVLITGFNRPEHLQNLINILFHLNCEIMISMDVAKPRDSKNLLLNKQCLRVIEKNKEKLSSVKIASENLGCFRAVTEGITWAFERSESLIIIEDDLEINEKFLEFATWALTKYKNNCGIGSIAGTNLYPGPNDRNMARLSVYTSSWGWATWRDRWDEYLEDLSEFPKNPFLRNFDFNMTITEKIYWRTIFRDVHRGKVDSWAYRWLYSNFKRQRLTVVPNKNLVVNLGYGKNATHTTDENNPWWLPIEISKEFKLDFDYDSLKIGLHQDDWMRKSHFRVGFWQQVRARLHKVSPTIYLQIKNLIFGSRQKMRLN